MMRVTDLEDFARAQVWGPFWPLHPDAPEGDGRPMSYRQREESDHTLMETVWHLRNHPEWADHVHERLARIGVTFPSYVKHPLVEEVRDGIDRANVRRFPKTTLYGGSDDE